MTTRAERVARILAQYGKYMPDGRLSGEERAKMTEILEVYFNVKVTDEELMEHIARLHEEWG